VAGKHRRGDRRAAVHPAAGIEAQRRHVARAGIWGVCRGGGVARGERAVVSPAERCPSFRIRRVGVERARIRHGDGRVCVSTFGLRVAGIRCCRVHTAVGSGWWNDETAVEALASQSVVREAVRTRVR
jgi:hypothetical protein